ncbi:MAG TPA: PQQ-dependent sugar dehydrogenase [Sphingomonas sp.]|jgi:glucose/arabinose dehydrogenase|nr:PQQ-dependent sugar dehydrogenase [Sphingomonas sp.]
MIRIMLTTAATIALATACSAEQPAPTAAVFPPQPAEASQPVPKNAPLDAAIKNVPATTGRANLTAIAPTFKVTPIGSFSEPFALAFLPDGRLLVTEKGGALKLRAKDGAVATVNGVPSVAAGGQGGLLDVAVAPNFAQSGTLYLSYAEPGAQGSALALAKARLDLTGAPALRDLSVIWRSGSNGPGGQFGATIAFAPDGRSLFLTSGERQRFTPAQDPEQLLGKIVRLTLDGKAWPGNPMYAAGGVRAMTWSTGHRNPYGLVFTPDGRLWEEEMGPQGGDELNLIEPGRNYGWPAVSNGDNYSGQPIPDHPSRPDLAAPKAWWNPAMSPGGMIAYTGAMFPAWRGSLLIAALSDKALIRVKVDGDRATAAEQFDMGTRIRDVAQAPDGSVWLLEDGGRGAGGKLLRLTPR